jgi:DNA-binding MarR family transcriptional regulator
MHQTLTMTLEKERDVYYTRARQEFAKRHKGFDPISMELLFNLVQTFSSCAAHLSTRASDYDMTLPGLNILCILSLESEKGIPLNLLSRLLLVSRANITGLVDSLVRKGFLKREDHAQDRRIILAKITKQGESWLNHYLPGHYARIRELLAGLTTAEKRTLTKLLHKLRSTSCPHPAASGYAIGICE